LLATYAPDVAKTWVPLALAASVLLQPLPAASSQVDDTRVLYQALEREGTVAVDGSDYHNDGFLKGGLTRSDGSYLFHPISFGDHRFDRISTPFDPSLNPGRAPFSYGARVRVSPTAEWRSHEMAVLRHGDATTPRGDFKLELRKTAAGLVKALCVIHDDDGRGAGYIAGHGALTTIADGQWHTIACGRVDRDTVSLTVDDHTIERQSNGDLGAVNGEDPLLIGCQYMSDGIHRQEQFVGRMDDIQITVNRRS
jgi:hypothetical protein